MAPGLLLSWFGALTTRSVYPSRFRSWVAIECPRLLTSELEMLRQSIQTPLPRP